MKDKPFCVLAYDIDELVSCLENDSLADKASIEKKFHRQYFFGYFAELKAKTIVVEKQYVDHDYLEDYAAYYVRCFKQYKNTTTRLHFFDIDFSENQFREILINEKSELTTDGLQDAYLGFIVVKPLPQTIIGRTCLKTYPSDDGRRNFPILRKYSVNLFGVSLEIESLAYQEQDSVVAACATSALWSCFQGTGKLFQHAIPSPVEITKAATKLVPEYSPGNSSRAFPNSGLTPSQAAMAVRDVGLEPYIVDTTNLYVLNRTLYAYLRCGMPSLFAFRLFDVVNGEERRLGAHAVAVTGFSLGHCDPIPLNPTGFLLRAARIDKIYAHDDQIGPFARMEHVFSDPPYLATSWRGIGEVKAVPWLLLLPLYHKIRIPFETVHDAILEVDSVIESFRQQFLPNLPRPEWDIYLTTVSDFKSDVFDSMRASPDVNSEQILTANLPRFLWRATAWIGAEQHLDLLFDATGIAQQNLLIFVIKSKPILPLLMTTVAPFVIDLFQNPQAKAIFKWFSTDASKENPNT